MQRYKTIKVHFMACVAINKTAWSAKLILTADLAYPGNCASQGHLLMAQHCHLGLKPKPDNWTVNWLFTKFQLTGFKFRKPVKCIVMYFSVIIKNLQMF